MLLLAGAFVCAAVSRGQEQAPVPAVNSTDRQQVIDLYQHYYLPGNNVAPGWTGDLATGVAGTLSPAYRTAILQRINFYRAMSSLPSALAFDATEDGRCQQAALMMAAQDDISHTPGTDWKFYTAAAAQAAADSNIRLDSAGDEGPGAVDRFMAETESNNYYVGHRRWFMYPGEGAMGAGVVPPSATNDGTSAIWIFNYFPRPAAPPSSSWPPAGYVPANLLFDRWSFSYTNADFSSAKVTVTKGGVPMTVEQEDLFGESANGSGAFIGDNTIVWELPGNTVDPAQDEAYAVRIDQVLIDGVMHTFTYAVTSINADPVLSTISLETVVPLAHRAGPVEGKFQVARNGDLTQALAVSYLLSGTGVPGVDYSPLSGTATFKAGKPLTRIHVVPLSSGKGKKTVTITLQPLATYTLGDPATSTVLIKK